MAGSLYIHPHATPLYNGVVVPFSKLYFSRTGTSTAQDSYSDSALTIANANPVVADATGAFGKIYLDPGTGFDYRVTWKTTAEVQLSQDDDVKAGQTTSANYRVIGPAPEYIFQETDAAANNARWRVRVNSEQLVISVGNDAESSWVDAITIDRTANTVDTINLIATAAQVNSGSIVTTGVGNFTPTWTGFSVAPTGNISYFKLGNLCVLKFGVNCTGTSNTTAMTITNVPTAIRPTTSTNPIAPYFPAIDNGAVTIASLRKVSTSTIEFFKGSAPPSLTGWTGSSTKGFEAETTIVYSL